MTAEELLKTLRDAGLDDETIKKLLGDTLASLTGPAEHDAERIEDDEKNEKAEAEKLLGVAL